MDAFLPQFENDKTLPNKVLSDFNFVVDKRDSATYMINFLFILGQEGASCSPLLQGSKIGSSTYVYENPKRNTNSICEALTSRICTQRPRNDTAGITRKRALNAPN